MQGGILESDKQIIQYKRKMVEDAQNQRWYYREDGVIYPQTNPNLVLDIRVSSNQHRSAHRHEINQPVKKKKKRVIGLKQVQSCYFMRENTRTMRINYGI